VVTQLKSKRILDLAGVLHKKGRKAIAIEQRSQMLGIDTNVLVRFLVRDDEAQV